MESELGKGALVPTSAPIGAVVVKFERVGRRRDVPDLETTIEDADELAEVVHRYAGRFLGSSDYAVTVDLEAGTGSIAFGRFGAFTVTREGQRRGD